MDTLSATATATSISTTFATTPRARLHHPSFKTTAHLPPPHHIHSIPPASAKLSNKPTPRYNFTNPPLINNPSQTPNSNPKQPPHQKPSTGYAVALLDAARCRNTLPAVDRDVERLSSWLRNHQQRRSHMHAATEPCMKGEILREVARKGKLEKHVVKLVELLIKKGKVDILGEVLLEFGKIYDQLRLDSKRSQLVMVSPGVKLEESQLLGIAKSVQKLTGAEEENNYVYLLLCLTKINHSDHNSIILNSIPGVLYFSTQEQQFGKEMSGTSAARTRTHVGKYELGKTLGEGSFAKVKFATNTQTGDCVAIKIIHRDRGLHRKMVEQIKREISTMKMIKHPNVLNLFEVMASRSKIYIVLEFVEGGELFDKIAKNGKLKEDAARKYFQQLIDAVDYCHSRGVYHRDLKPENLLLDSYGNLKVSDFGLSAFSKQVREDGLFHTTCGTPNYIAPEVLTDKGYDGTSSDIWSCGVILFVLIAGYLPFNEPNLVTLFRRIKLADFSFPSWFSSGSKKLIKRILDPNPLTRMTVPDILENDWFKKDYRPPHFGEEKDVSLDDVDAVFNDSVEHFVTESKEKPVSMNAFELISRSRSFSLENLFNKQMGLVKRETGFTSKCPANEIMSKIEEAAKPMGFHVQKRNYKMKLQGDRTGRKGQLFVATEVFEMAPSLHMVELHKTGGDTLEFHKFYKTFSSGLKDIVWTSESDDDKSSKMTGRRG